MKKDRGFTLVELMVVVVVIAILAALAIPQYIKAVETSKADDAISTLQIIGASNRSFLLDYSVYTTGQLTDGCSTTCPCSGGTCGATPSSCALLSCRYISLGNFSNRPYDFYGADGNAFASDPCGLSAPSANYTACAKRKSGAPPGTTSSTYSSWGYVIDIKSKVTPYPSTNGPPAPPN